MTSNIYLLLEELEQQAKKWREELKQWKITGGPEGETNQIFLNSSLSQQRAIKALYQPLAAKRAEIEARIKRYAKPIEIPTDIDKLPSELELKQIIFDYKYRIKYILDAKNELKKIGSPTIAQVEDQDQILSLIEELYHDKLNSILFLIEKSEVYIRLQKRDQSISIEVINLQSGIKNYLGTIDVYSMKEAGFQIVNNQFVKIVEGKPQYFYEIVGVLGFLLIEVFRLKGEFNVVAI